MFSCVIEFFFTWVVSHNRTVSGQSISQQLKNASSFIWDHLHDVYMRTPWHKVTVYHRSFVKFCSGKQMGQNVFCMYFKTHIIHWVFFNMNWCNNFRILCQDLLIVITNVSLFLWSYLKETWARVILTNRFL